MNSPILVNKELRVGYMICRIYEEGRCIRLDKHVDEVKKRS